MGVYKITNITHSGRPVWQSSVREDRFLFYNGNLIITRGGQIKDFSRTAPPYLGTYWSKSPGNFSSASTIDAFRDFRKKKNISAQQNAAMRTRTLFKTQYVYLVLLVQSWHVIPFSACTESQESKYDVRSHNQTRQCTLRPFLRPNMYLWCYWSNLGMWYHFPCVFVQSCSTGGGRSRSEGWFLQGERSFNVFGAARPRWHEKWLPQRGNHDCRNWANVADRS